MEQTGKGQSVSLSDKGAFWLGREGLDLGLDDPLRLGGVSCCWGSYRQALQTGWLK